MKIEKPVTREKVEALARSRADDPSTVVEVVHPGYNADAVSGGFAFVSDRELLVYNLGGGCMFSLAPEEHDAQVAKVDQWWRDTQHRARPLDLGDVSEWHQAAISTLAAGLNSVADLAIDRRPGITDTAVADYLFVFLRRHAKEPTQAAALQALASNDWLLEMPNDHGRAHRCPLCGKPAIGEPWQYVSVCDTCYPKTTCPHGRVVTGYNTSIGGGFEAQHVDDQTVCETVTRDGIVTIDGYECHMGEAKFGGVFVGVLPSSWD